MNEKHYEPKGLTFYSKARSQEMILVTDGPHKDWICFKHPDGQWVTLRKATDSDLNDLAVAMSTAHHLPDSGNMM